MGCEKIYSNGKDLIWNKKNGKLKTNSKKQDNGNKSKQRKIKNFYGVIFNKQNQNKENIVQKNRNYRKEIEDLNAMREKSREVKKQKRGEINKKTSRRQNIKQEQQVNKEQER